MKLWLRLVLAGSLALNLLVVGAVAGAVITHKPWRGHHAPRLDGVGGPLTRALAPQDRRAIARGMRRAYHDGRPARAEIRAAFEALIADLEAGPFDADAVAAHLERQRSVLAERLAVGQELLLDRLNEMSEAERAAYAGRLRAVLAEHRRHHGR
ncbi:periplasmic heavy metal sensor [Roseovarius salinarum]|uniref:periplasmic heavy metal sensor n=1 Tax=Roseovarius salinarum TaxID=1981892 RepID=UPI001E4CE978|nr:periplasmic heavy metal sensor [Roseovarius salinarum]